MATTIANLAIKIIGSTAGLASSLAPGFAALQGFAARVNTLGASITTGILGLGLVQGIRSSIQAFAEEEKAVAKLNAVLSATGNMTGFTTAQLAQMASEIQRTTVFADELATDAQAVLAGFGNIRGDNFEAALKASTDLATHLGTDLVSAARRVGQALADPEKGMQALRKANVVFTEAEQKTIKTLVEAGEIAAAQTIILGKFSDAIGGEATNAAKTLTGQLEQVWNRINDMQEGIGKQLLPLVILLTKGIEALVGWIAEWQGVIVPIVVAIGLLVVALKALAIISAVATAVASGPAALITAGLLAAGAAAAAIGVAAAMDGVTESSSAAAQEATKVGNAMKGGSEGAKALASGLDEAGNAAKALVKQQEEMERKGKSLTESLRTPIEIYVDKIAEADKLLQAGVITMETWGRAAKKAGEEFKNAADSKHQFEVPARVQVGAVTRGTTAGFSAVQEGRHQIDALAKIQQQQLVEDRQQTALQKEMAKLLAERGVTRSVSL